MGFIKFSICVFIAVFCQLQGKPQNNPFLSKEILDQLYQRNPAQHVPAQPADYSIYQQAPQQSLTHVIADHKIAIPQPILPLAEAPLSPLPTPTRFSSFPISPPLKTETSDIEQVASLLKNRNPNDNVIPIYHRPNTIVAHHVPFPSRIIISAAPQQNLPDHLRPPPYRPNSQTIEEPLGTILAYPFPQSGDSQNSFIQIERLKPVDNNPLPQATTLKPSEVTVLAEISDNGVQGVEGALPPQAYYLLRRSCLKARGQFPTSKCNTYVNCWDDIVLEQNCPPGLLFNTAGYCDYAANVDCEGKRVEGGVLLPSNNNGVNPPDNGGNQQLLLEGADNKDPITVVNLPQGGVLLPPNNNGVNPPDNGGNQQVLPEGTGNRDPITVVNLPPASLYLRSKCAQTRGQFPTDLCNKYVNCWDTGVLEEECPPGLLFSEKGYCDYPYNVNCNNRTYIKINLVSLCPSAYGTFRDNTNCSRYFTCAANEVVARFECAEGLRYNADIGICDYDYKVNCFEAYKPNQPEKIPPTEFSKISFCPTENGTFGDSTNCSRYYICSGNQVVGKYECAVGLKYNPLIGLCDYEINVKCPQEVKPSKPDIDEQKIPSGLVDATRNCKPGTVYRLNPACSSAAVCRSSLTEVIHCPDGLSYDSRFDKCVLSAIARC